MAYLTINKLADSGLFVVESIHQNKDVVHENISAEWRQKRPGEEPPNFAAQLGYMADDLDESRIAMVSSLEMYLNESTVNVDFTAVRDEAVSEMRTWYQFVRDSCVKICGEKATRELGFDLVTEQHPWRMERQAQRAINVFKERDPEAKLGVDHPLKAEAALRIGYVLSVLEPAHDRLADVLGMWIRRRKGTEKALIRKDNDLKAYQKKFSIYAKNAEMLYRWAGLEEEARRIKPSLRRPGQRAVVDDEGDSDAPDAPADAPNAGDSAPDSDQP